ncbi:MAG: hypothetical protein ACFCVK_16700 [Acidimicrobiales bacterium]
MIAVALVTEAQQTQRTITALIILLLVVATMLALLTLWYWRHTNPRRYVRRVLPELDRDVDLRHQQGYIEAGAYPGHQGYQGQPGPHGYDEPPAGYRYER